MITDLTALDIANASLLDEATAAAEAMTLCHAVVGATRHIFRLRQLSSADDRGRADARRPLGIEVTVGNHAPLIRRDRFSARCCSIRPRTARSSITQTFIASAHAAGALVIVAADLLALTLLRPPGELGADVAVGSSQRFGVPLGFGGPHAAYFATRDQYKRHMPGRLVGVSHDAPDARLIASRCRHASNTSAATKRRATSARRRCFSRSWPRCMRSIMDQKDCGELPFACITSPAAWPRASSSSVTSLAPRGFLRYDPGGSGKRGSGEFLRRGVAKKLQPACPRARQHRNFARRSDHAGDIEVLLDSSAKTESCFRERPRQIANRKSQIATSDFLTHPVFNTHDTRDRNAALYAPARSARSFTLPFHDPARLLHDEVECDCGDVSDFVAGVCAASSLCA